MKKGLIIEHFDRAAARRPAYFRRNIRYHQQILNACKPFLNSDSRVLELGCSTGDLLSMLNPAYGVGVDISPVSIKMARQNHPQYKWVEADVENLPQSPIFDQPFDLVILSDLVGYLDDVQQTFESIRSLLHNHSRVIISIWNWIWQPALALGEMLGVKSPDLHTRQDWLSVRSVCNLLELEDYEILQINPGYLFPYEMPPISTTLNLLSHAPLFHNLTLLHSIVACPKPHPTRENFSVTVVIPTRNEKGNIEEVIRRVPEMGSHTELLFIDGSSTDGTVEKIHQQIEQHPERDIKFMPQVSSESSDSDTPPDLMLTLGKGDAIRKAFTVASGDVLMILDSDITVPPEDLPKFYNAIVTSKGRFINGTRFNYSQEVGAMRPLNRLGNVFFSLAFSWLLGQRITDTLCGTKVLWKKDYKAIAENRSYFGDFDPFGDFDLLFGAAWLGHKIVEIPIRYRARTYGDSKVRVGLHGPLLGRMSLIALWHFKIRPLLDLDNKNQTYNSENRSQKQLKAHFTRWTVLLMIFVGVFTWLLKRKQ